MRETFTVAANSSVARPHVCPRTLRRRPGPHAGIAGARGVASPACMRSRCPNPVVPRCWSGARCPIRCPARARCSSRSAAGAVNRADLLQRQGFYPPPPGASAVPRPGVLRRGSPRSATASTGWSVGDEVCALLSGGGYAEQVAVPAGQLLPVPDGRRPGQRAAALPEVACTVWSNVFMLAGAAPRRDAARARRLQRHRHDGDPARQGASAPRVAVTAGHGGEARRAAASSAPTS